MHGFMAVVCFRIFGHLLDVRLRVKRVEISQPGTSTSRMIAASSQKALASTKTMAPMPAAGSRARLAMIGQAKTSTIANAMAEVVADMAKGRWASTRSTVGLGRDRGATAFSELGSFRDDCPM